MRLASVDVVSVLPKEQREMSDITESTAVDTAKRRLVAGRSIAIGDDTLIPRRQLAAELGMTDQAIARLNLRTVIIARVAHVMRNASLQEIASRAKRRHEPPRRRGTERKR
jgi:hypothetical protein